MSDAHAHQPRRLQLPPERHFPTARVLQILQNGRVRQQLGVLPWSSNHCYLLMLACDEDELLAIYKPQRGERALWDFPRGTLCYREVAAYETAAALGWQLVPPTTLRDGPLGIGSLQRFIYHDPEQHYFNFSDEAAPTLAQLQRLALFDCLINNADRKGGHCLLDARGQLWAIDHGVTFHAEDKLRTVIWDFAGQPLPEALQADLDAIAGQFTDGGELNARLNALLSESEIAALSQRARELLATGHYPNPGPGHNYPWPPI